MVQVWGPGSRNRTGSRCSIQGPDLGQGPGSRREQSPPRAHAPTHTTRCFFPAKKNGWCTLLSTLFFPHNLNCSTCPPARPRIPCDGARMEAQASCCIRPDARMHAPTCALLHTPRCTHLCLRPDAPPPPDACMRAPICGRVHMHVSVLKYAPICGHVCMRVSVLKHTYLRPCTHACVCPKAHLFAAVYACMCLY